MDKSKYFVTVNGARVGNEVQGVEAAIALLGRHMRIEDRDTLREAMRENDSAVVLAGITTGRIERLSN